MAAPMRRPDPVADPVLAAFDRRQAASAALRRQRDASLSLLAGMQAEREERAALAPPPAVSAEALLADMARVIAEA